MSPHFTDASMAIKTDTTVYMIISDKNDHLPRFKCLPGLTFGRVSHTLPLFGHLRVEWRIYASVNYAIIGSAPSHPPNQSWHIVNRTISKKFKSKYNNFHTKECILFVVCKLVVILSLLHYFDDSHFKILIKYISLKGNILDTTHVQQNDESIVG